MDRKQIAERIAALMVFRLTYANKRSVPGWKQALVNYWIGRELSRYERMLAR